MPRMRLGRERTGCARMAKKRRLGLPPRGGRVCSRWNGTFPPITYCARSTGSSNLPSGVLKPFYGSTK